MLLNTFLSPVDEVSEVVEQLAVVFCHEVVPAECAVLTFWSDEQEVEAPDVRWDACVLGVVAKHTNTARLGKLALFIVEIFLERK